MLYVKQFLVDSRSILILLRRKRNKTLNVIKYVVLQFDKPYSMVYILDNSTFKTKKALIESRFHLEE